MLVRCQVCGDVHPTETDTEKTIPVRIVISRGDESFKTNALFEETQLVTTNEELVVEDQNGEDVYPIQITSIETLTKREEYAKIADVETIWARAIDEVDVKISVQSIGNTNPHTKRVPGEEIFEVGLEYEAGGERFRITQRGKPVAEPGPVHANRNPDAAEAARGMKAFRRKHHPITDVDIRALQEEGRD